MWQDDNVACISLNTMAQSAAKCGRLTLIDRYVRLLTNIQYNFKMSTIIAIATDIGKVIIPYPGAEPSN